MAAAGESQRQCSCYHDLNPALKPTTGSEEQVCVGGIQISGPPVLTYHY